VTVGDDALDGSAELKKQLESAEQMLANATKAFKRVRQMRGANAHERSWHFKEQMDKTQARIDRINSELDAFGR
jgi:multidrug resistance efflux pump